MNIPKLTADLAVIQKLSDLPNATDGLSAEELKAKFDEAAKTIQDWINETLIPAISAENIPFTKSHEINAETVEAAIHSVYEQIKNAGTGSIVNGSVTKEKLAQPLLDRVFGGRVWIGVDTPGEANNPATDFPVGQLWLRPSHSIKNLLGNNWAVTGCAISVVEGELTMTGNQTVSTASAVYTATSAGAPGDRVYVLLDVAEKDAEISSLSVSINGGEAFSIGGNHIFETNMTGTSLSVRISAQWPSASLAKGSVVIRNATAINVSAVLRSLPGAHDRADWRTWLRTAVPFETVDFGREMYVQTAPGVWQLFDQEVLAVSHGGTGVSSIGDGEMLFGKDGGFAKLEKPENGTFLQFDNGNPVWAAMGALAGHGFSRILCGSYEGNAEDRTINLPIEPKLLVIHDGEKAAVLQDGTYQEQSLSASYIDSMTSGTYTAGVQLNGNKLTTYMKGYEAFQNPQPKAWNQSGTTHHWVAIY